MTAKKQRISKITGKPVQNRNYTIKPGRPLKYSELEGLQSKIDEYFREADKAGMRYTVPGLAYFLGFVERKAIWEYKQRPKFSPTIKRALLRIEQQRAHELLTENNPVGKIFDLKNNFGWKDEKQLDVAGSLKIEMVDRFSDEND